MAPKILFNALLQALRAFELAEVSTVLCLPFMKENDYVIGLLLIYVDNILCFGTFYFVEHFASVKSTVNVSK